MARGSMTPERLAEIRELVKRGPDGRLMGAWDSDPRAQVLTECIDELLVELDRYRGLDGDIMFQSGYDGFIA